MWKKRSLTTLSLLILMPFLSVTVFAQTPSPPAGAVITLSEVFACKQTEGSEDNKIQWVEFYNSSDQAVDLNGWKLVKNTATSNEKAVTGSVPAKGYFRFPVGSTSQGFFNQSGFGFKLVDNQNFTWESFPSEFKTNTDDLEECPSGNPLMSWIKAGQTWSVTTSVTNSGANTLSAPATSPTPTPAGATPTPSSANQPSNISLSEIYACQEENGKEWVELFNNNTESVTLTNWQILDDDNNDQPIASLTISGKGYGVIEISKYSRGMLTNDGDVVILKNGAGTEVEKKEYSSCAKDKSLAKIGSEWKETTKITKGSANEYVGSSSSTATATPTPKPSSSPTPKTSASPSLSPSPSSSASASPEPTPEGDVLGLSMEEPSSSPEPEEGPSSSGEQALWPAFLAMGGGIAMVAGVGGYLGYDWYTKKYGKVPFKIPFLKSA